MYISQYKKGWLATSIIAQELIGAQTGDRIPTIQEYVTMVNASRGVVQNALQVLQDKGAVALEKLGKRGTFIKAINEVVLFQLAGIHFITGTMPPPGTKSFSGLASGISLCMHNCPVPLNFAYMMGAGNRVDALKRGAFDFVIASKSAAIQHATADPELEIVTTLSNCTYANPYVFCSWGEDIVKPQEGMTIASDTKSTDQFRLTQQLLAETKNVKFIKSAFHTSRALFLEHKIDCLVYPKDETLYANGAWFHPLEAAKDNDLCIPAVLALRNNHAIKRILLMYLENDKIACIQKQVINQEIEPQFF